MGPPVRGRVHAGVRATMHACKPVAGAAPPSPPVRGSSDLCLAFSSGKAAFIAAGRELPYAFPSSRMNVNFADVLLMYFYVEVV